MAWLGFGESGQVPTLSTLVQFHHLPSLDVKGKDTVLLDLTHAPELNIPSWGPGGGSALSDTGHVMWMERFTQCLAPGG